MLKPDRKYFENLSEKTNFQKDILEKVFRLADLLRTIYDNEFLMGKLIIKGGTAINFIYFTCLVFLLTLISILYPGNREKIC